VSLAAAALGFDHANAAVWPHETAREQQRRPRLAATGLAVKADQRLGLRARGGAECEIHLPPKSLSGSARSTLAALSKISARHLLQKCPSRPPCKNLAPNS